MNRINIIRRPSEEEQYSNPDAQPELVGWFDADRAEAFQEQRRWDGQNMVSVNAGRWQHQILYRTAGGRWVLHEWSQWNGVEPIWEFVTDEQAREWLLRNDEDWAVERHFGPVEDERGPGRPEIGPAFSVRFPAGLLAELDAVAKRRGTSRADILRQAAESLVRTPQPQTSE